MIFNPSPALHKIRQLVQLFRRHPVPSRPSRYAPWPGDDRFDRELPDPSQFIDTSVKKTNAMSDLSMSDASGSHTRRKRASSPSRITR
jgi:hypothetical protein